VMRDAATFVTLRMRVETGVKGNVIWLRRGLMGPRLRRRDAGGHFTAGLDTVRTFTVALASVVSSP
jgi:hypothetical protein